MKLLIIFFIFWMCRSEKGSASACSSDELTPEFSIKTDIRALVGHSLEVNCSVSNRDDEHNNCSIGVLDQHKCSLTEFSLSNLMILHCTTSSRDSCIPQATSAIDDNTISLTRTKLTLSDTGTYFCQYNRSATTEDNFTLMVKYKPVVTDISCISNDLSDLTCSWRTLDDDPKTTYPVRYSSYFLSSPLYGKFDCPHPLPESCYISSPRTRGQNYTFNMLTNYTLVIRVSFSCGQYIRTHHIKPENIVKFSSPIVASVIPGDRNIALVLNLEFPTKQALVLIKSITYQIHYKSLYSDQLMELTSGNSSRIHINLTNLVPFTTYNIILRIRGPETEGDTYNSDPVSLNKTTLEAAPGALPEISLGGFSRFGDQMHIYFKPPDARYKYSSDAVYQVSFNDSQKSFRCFNVSWDTTTINVTHLPQHSTYNIKIETVNSIGRSSSSKLINIPTQDKGRPLPQNIIVERSNQDYHILWEAQLNTDKNPKNVTVYWCHGDRHSHYCYSDLNWITIPTSKTNASIRGLKDQIKGEWMFAIAFQYPDGYSTGMIFAQCYFPSTTEAPNNVNVLNFISKSRTEIQIKPLIYCNTNTYPSRPLLYVVYYKENPNKDEKCDKNFLNITEIAKPDTEEITLKHLRPDTNYSVCLEVKTLGGSIMSSPHFLKTQTIREDLSTKPYIILFVLLFVCVVVVVFFVVFCKIRKRWKKPIEFNLPTINPARYERVSTQDKDNQMEKITKISLKLSESGSVDSGVSSNNLSTSDSSVNKQQKSNLYDKNVSDSITEEKETNNKMNIDVSSSANSTKNVHAQTVQYNAELVERPRTESNVTDTSNGYSAQLTYKSSRATSSTMSSITSELRRQRLPLKNVFDLISDDSHDMHSSFQIDQRSDKTSPPTSTKGTNEKSDNKNSSMNQLLFRQGSFEKKREEYIREWIRKSNEDLPQSLSLVLPKDEYNNSSQSTMHQNSDSIQEYVQVDRDGSVKSSGKRSVSKHSKINSTKDSEPISVELKHKPETKTMMESPNGNSSSEHVKENDVYSQTNCSHSDKQSSQNNSNTGVSIIDISKDI